MCNKLKKCFISVFFIALIFPRTVFASNLLSNPGFEEDFFSGWTTGSGLEMVINVTISSYTKNNGQYSCEIKHSKTGSYGALQIIQGIVGGNKYKGKGYVLFNNEHNKSARVRIAWYSSSDGSGSQMKTVDSNVIVDLLPSWQIMDTGIIEAPSEAGSAEFRILLASSDEEEALAYFDDFSFEEVVPTPTDIPPTSTPVSSPTPTPVSYGNIYINEFLPDPESGYERVEIKNNNDFSVSLVNWQIDDIENGGSSPKTFSADISPSGLYTIDLGTNSFLNNDGDSVRLLDFSGSQKDKKEYSSSAGDLSWVKDRNGNWCEQDSSFNTENSDCPTSTSAPTLTPTPTSTPVPTSTPKPTPTSKFSPTPTLRKDELSASESAEEILGAQTASDGFDIDLNKTATGSSENQGKKKKFNFWPFVFIVPGLGMISFSVLLFRKQKI